MMNPCPPLSPLSSWTLGDVAAIVRGDIDARFAERSFAPVSTDSRSVAPGEFFLALRGEKFDGHRFCEMAAGRGAAGLIVDRQYEIPPSLAELPILAVGDTLRAYGDLAAARRREWGGPALAISGSAGKTTTRRLVADALRRHLRVLEPLQNYNNLIGVPHTLLRLKADHEIAVLELGMNLPGELARLTEIADPDVLLLLGVGTAHVGQARRGDPAVIAMLQGKVLEHDRGVGELLRAEERGQLVQSLVGDFHVRDIALALAARAVARSRRLPGEGIEDRRCPCAGEPDDDGFHSHSLHAELHGSINVVMAPGNRALGVRLSASCGPA